MQTQSFTSCNPASWAVLAEQPFMDGNAGGRWACGAGRAWGVMEAGDDFTNRYCTSCPPCTVDRFPTRLMIRDNGAVCCNDETYNRYETESWPYVFAANSTCPRPESAPLWQDLQYVRNYAPESIPLAVPFNPYIL